MPKEKEDNKSEIGKVYAVEPSHNIPEEETSSQTEEHDGE